MEHICVSGRSSIFAVQTVVRSYMLKMLQKRINDKNAEKKMVEALDKFLKWIDSLRNDIEYSKESFSFVHAHVSSCLEPILWKLINGTRVGKKKCGVFLRKENVGFSCRVCCGSFYKLSEF